MNSTLQKLQKIALIVVVLIMVISCGSSKEVKKVVKKVNDKELREKLLSDRIIDYNFFYTKLNVDYQSKAVNQSVKSSLKMTIDSAFSGTLSYSGFIVANYIATKDSLKASYKQKKCYFTENITYISSILGVELEYDFFENMLLGKPIGIVDGVKYKQIKDKESQYYILSSHRKRKYKKIEKDKINLDDDKNDDIFMRYYFSADSLELVKQIIEIPFDTVSISINYVEKTIEDDRVVPEYTTLVINHPKDTIKIGLSYNKQSIDRRKNHVFNIPQQYENCNQ